MTISLDGLFCAMGVGTVGATGEPCYDPVVQFLSSRAQRRCAVVDYFKATAEYAAVREQGGRPPTPDPNSRTVSRRG